MSNDIMSVQEGFYDEIVQILHEETGQHVNVMGEGGVIISSTRPERIGTIHESARQIMLGMINEALVTEEEAAKLEGVRAGCNLPIEYQGKRIGVIGMTGDPQMMKPIVRVAVRTVILWIKNNEHQIKQQKAAENVYGQLQNMAATIEELAASSEDFAVTSKSTSAEVINAGDQVKEVTTALKLIKDIASQSKLIGLNAAIEAARAGEAGRGFTIVANEIRKLASNSEESVKQVQEILVLVHQAFANILQQVQVNENKAKEQSIALQELAKYVEEVEDMMENLVQE
ncbi:sugar diacid recognition domain-containing protein [Tepidibacillus infernus]|uniref:Methyl-accepting transducer domain-containing protein n=1 Tax=Tepidibacillus decaturensis TaxID=1413211 RepID=A0A135L1A7_9BACI|nr:MULTISPECIES: sugar diacid recognition domain-containing protein [Tepidibacillus]KXG42758.1 hypothetical protein U473_00875 [Tepidibacillus decaturensis]